MVENEPRGTNENELKADEIFYIFPVWKIKDIQTKINISLWYKHHFIYLKSKFIAHEYSPWKHLIEISFFR